MNSEFVKRFLKLEAQDLGQWALDPFYLSKDRTIGLMKKPDFSKFISLGKFKLRHPRVHHKFIHILDMYLDVERLYRAMRVFRRRKKFELGFYYLRKDRVFALREGDSIIVIAPAIFEDQPNVYIEFKNLVERISKSFFEKWAMWSKILLGLKY